MKGKVALITGAAQGIGKQTALAFAEYGTNIINGQTITVDGGWTSDASWESLRLKYRKA